VSTRKCEAGKTGAKSHLTAAAGTVAPMCAMRTPIMCRKVSNCPQLRIAPTGCAPQWQRRPHARVEQHQLVLTDNLQLVRGLPHPCAPRADQSCTKKGGTGRNCMFQPPAARAGGSGVRTRRCIRAEGYSPTSRSCYDDRRTHVRDAHTDNVPKSIELLASAHCTRRPRAPGGGGVRTRGCSRTARVLANLLQPLMMHKTSRVSPAHKNRLGRLSS